MEERGLRLGHGRNGEIGKRVTTFGYEIEGISKCFRICEPSKLQEKVSHLYFHC